METAARIDRSHNSSGKMDFTWFKYLVAADLYRYTGQKSAAAFWRLLRDSPGFKYTFAMRLCCFLRSGRLARFSLYPLANWVLKHYMFKFGINIPYETQIGAGLFIGHFGGIVINARSVIGKNCNLSHGVTLGQANRGKSKGYPTIGDNVYIGPGAKIVGNVKVGNNVAIGANCVVTRDVPDNAVVVGIPGQVISYKGAEDYVENTDYHS